MLKVIRVDVKGKTVRTEELSPEYARFGGRGLIAKTLTEEMNPAADALGAENKFILCTSLLAGMGITSTNRLSVGGKSPLTDGIKEANAGGTVGKAMADIGVRMIVVENEPAAEEWFILAFDKNGEPALLDGREYLGLNNYELSERLKQRFGEKMSVASIGTAGERLSRIASVQVTDFTSRHPARSAARGGLGAIMGSKHLKAVVFEPGIKSFKPEYADKAAFDAAKKAVTDVLMGSPMRPGMMEGGTTANTEMSVMGGVTPVRNFSPDRMSPGALEGIARDKWIERCNMYGGRCGVPCQAGCILKCSNVFNDERGEMVSAAIEYETSALVGPNLDIGDYEHVAYMDRFCDDIGIDTIEFGGVVGELMEAGIIPWGDKDAVRALTEKVYAGEGELAEDVLAGTYVTGQKYGVKHIPTIKRQCLAGYDPRNSKGTGVSYATSPMGADHTAGLVVGPFDTSNKEGMVARSTYQQQHAAAADNLTCSFAFDFAFNNQLWADIMSGVYGGEWTNETLLALGRETLRMEREFNLKAGMTDGDDIVPQFFYEEPSYTGAVYDIPAEELHELVKEIYK